MKNVTLAGQRQLAFSPVTCGRICAS